ncbi:hypothetical protein SSX86_023719 [Deinandra increscens subsp. villosa]|uniref:NB-ARC domain-containing protein n=1 Tax=Deinandra increscens subsp. villosa TaxID=3103831 RepID=A0AAP0GTU7_9ASTR
MLQESLQFRLRGKRFLLVLDDVWIEESEKNQWDQLSETLSCGAEGSIVVMTARFQTTSQMMAKVPELQHKLECLSEEDSWLLFKKLAFAEGRKGDNISELEPIGREIVEKCKGYDMEKDVLVSLWVSNGFTRANGEVDLYMLGEQVFDYLVWRSLISKVKKLARDRYILHDLMHDMARHVMGDDCLVLEPGKEVIIPNEVLHLSSSCPSLLFSPQDLEKLTSLRSIFMYGKMNEGSISQIFNHAYLRVLYLHGIRLKTLPESVYKLKHLKYLNVSHSGIEVISDSIICLQNLQALVLCSCQMLRELPESVCELKQLKYLDLSHSSIESLPESFIHLQNLQVLLLSFCSGLRKLPEGLRRMTNLRSLDINFCYSLMHLPLGIQKLTRLRILSLFRLGDSSGAKIGELGDLNLIEGALEIVPLESVGGFSEAKSANLKRKINLQVLLLRWSGIRPTQTTKESFRVRHDEEVLEGLEPNPSLRELKIFFNMGKTISPSWILSLTNLTEISFYTCKNCEQIPPLGRLPNLRVINLSYMDSLKSFHHDDKENMLPDTTDMFLCLQELHVYECPNLVCLPSNLPKLEAMCSGVVLLIPEDTVVMMLKKDEEDTAHDEGEFVDT